MSAPWMNAFSLACLALFVVDMMFISRRLIQVAVHLSLSLIALKAFHLRTGRDRAQFALLAFFLAVAGAANSTHPLLALHLLALTVLYASWLMQAAGAPPRSARRTAAVLSGACFLIAAPLFLVLPRLRDPYVPGVQQRAGEAPAFTLDSLGLGGVAMSRNDERVALRVRYEGPGIGEESLRLRARTFSDFRGRDWGNGAMRHRMVRFRPDGTAWLGPREGRRRPSYELFPKELSPQYLPLPYGTAGLEARLAYAHAGIDGTVRLSSAVSRRQFHYRAFVDPEAAPPPDPAGEGHLALPPALDRELRALAGEIMPEGLDPPAQVARMTGYFASEFRYAIEDYGAARDPLREFLFVRKSGHCEYYATAGALLLRARGIPARVAAGFMGGERNPLQDYYVVRFRNAHAWVEAWMDGAWVVVDPTPPDFRPSLVRGTLAGQAQFLWETISFFWDRHVIGFAFGDQVDLLETLEEASGPVGRAGGWLAGAALLALAALKAAHSFRPESVLLRRYRRLRRAAARLTKARESTLTPQAVEQAVLAQSPGLAAEAAAFFGAYRRASFGVKQRKGENAARPAYRRLRAALSERRSGDQRPGPFPHSTL